MAGDTAPITCELCTHRATILDVDDDGDIWLALCACCFRDLLGLTDGVITLLAAGLVPSRVELDKLRAAGNN